MWEASLFAEHDFHDIKISVKHHDPVVMVRAYELLAEQCDYPLHLGVTEAGPAFQGTIKSAVAFGALLRQGIGDTIRVSLSAPPVEEVKVGTQILQSLNLRPRKLEIVSCPSCGRAQVDVYKLADEVTAGLTGMEVPLRVAVMGCVVNGPGEAREADLGVASGNGKGQIFVKGEVIKTVPEHADRRDADRGGDEARRGHGDERRASGHGRLRWTSTRQRGSGWRSRRHRQWTSGRCQRRIGMAARRVLRVAGARLLDDRDRAGVRAALDDDPVAACMVAARVEVAGLDPWRLGGELWGRRARASTASASPAPTSCRSAAIGPRCGSSPIVRAGAGAAARRSSDAPSWCCRCGTTSPCTGRPPARCGRTSR